LFLNLFYWLQYAFIFGNDIAKSVEGIIHHFDRYKLPNVVFLFPNSLAQTS